MRKTGTKDIYKFDTFGEMVAFLKGDPDRRTVDFGRNLINYVGVFGNEKDGLEFRLVRLYGEGDDDFETESLKDYFDENGVPLDEDFARDFDIGEFVGFEEKEA